jgi:hypothetical protein
MGLCKNCKYWGKEPEPDDHTFIDARTCELEPFDLRDMKEDQCAVVCGHDGGIVYGRNFGCIHFEKLKIKRRTSGKSE